MPPHTWAAQLLPPHTAWAAKPLAGQPLPLPATYYHPMPGMPAPAGVVTWKQCLADHQALDTVIWFGVLMTMSSQLNTLGLIPWLSSQARRKPPAGAAGEGSGRPALSSGCLLAPSGCLLPAQLTDRQPVRLRDAAPQPAAQVVKHVGGLGLGWRSSFVIILAAYFYSHHVFASSEQHLLARLLGGCLNLQIEPAQQVAAAAC